MEKSTSTTKFSQKCKPLQSDPHNGKSLVVRLLSGINPGILTNSNNLLLNNENNLVLNTFRISKVMVILYLKLIDTFTLQSQFHKSCLMTGEQVFCTFIDLYLTGFLPNIFYF